MYDAEKSREENIGKYNVGKKQLAMIFKIEKMIADGGDVVEEQLKSLGLMSEIVGMDKKKIQDRVRSYPVGFSVDNKGK